ncbi:all trans-polyprenyl-diphosphate synthase PDSS2-like [Uloborus diversus]|uniref:all trans-polyprenyl-diphosphate synthase PDSS2-like n=1 Tax=Uloborus diversus TaxID=327109 RepID=UPI00240A3F7F|nr:all trans-polyprenyl-diphosphate synthase PDSS2-like [Uloborus diversus]
MNVNKVLCQLNSISFCVPRLIFFQASHTLSHTVRLSDIPDICTSEEWNTVIQDSRAALQRYTAPSNSLGYRNPISVNAVVQRLQKTSSRHSHLINAFRQVLNNTDEAASRLRWPGLITLLISKGIGCPFETDNFISKRAEDVIWSSQILLAEIINLLHCHNVFRKENCILSSSRRKKENFRTFRRMEQIVSDYFTSSTVSRFSGLRNSKVLHLLSEVLESQAKTRIENFRNFDIHTIYNLKAWEIDAFYPQGILLANGCQAALELAGYSERIQKMAFEFGQSFSFAIKANADIQQFQSYQSTQSSTINTSGLPVVLHLSNNPETLANIYAYGRRMDNIDLDQLNSIVISSRSVQQAKEVMEKYVKKTEDILNEFEPIKKAEIIEYLFRLVKTLKNT